MVGPAELGEVSELRELEALFATIWERAKEPPLNAETLRALSHSGNYVAGAWRDGRLIGGLVGFLGRRASSELLLHSHILGVRPEAQAQGVGFALKQHQRRWATERGIETVTWTFDPLVRRNAYFNLAKLGGEVAAYHVDFYGGMSDAINARDETDRVVVRWSTGATRPAAPEVEALLEAGAVVTLRVDADGGPAPAPRRAAVQLCQVPEDIVALRRSWPELASRWRLALRDALGGALAEGRRVVGVTRSGWYVLAGDP